MDAQVPCKHDCMDAGGRVTQDQLPRMSRMAELINVS